MGSGVKKLGCVRSKRAEHWLAMGVLLFLVGREEVRARTELQDVGVHPKTRDKVRKAPFQVGHGLYCRIRGCFWRGIRGGAIEKLLDTE